MDKTLGITLLIVGILYIWAVHIYDPELAKYAAGGYIAGVFYLWIRTNR